MKYKNNKQTKYKKLSCPICKSNLIIKKGFRKTENRGLIQRFSCKNCSYRFVIDDGFFRMRNNPQKIIYALDLFYRGVSTRKVQFKKVFNMGRLYYKEKRMTEHKIICGDCIEELKKISDEGVDLIVTDPPFNIGKIYNSYADNRSREEYLGWCKSWLNECIRVLKYGGALYLFNYPENNAFLMPFLNDKLTFKRWMTWHYPVNTGMSPTNFTRSQHSILFYIKGDKPKIFNKDDIAEPYRNPTDKRILERIKNGSKGKTPYDVFQFNLVKNVSKDKTSHPCQIPVPLLEIFIKASSNKGDLVLDPFGGSFSTAHACKKLDRNSISIEIDKHYCEIGKMRLQKTAPLKNFI